MILFFSSLAHMLRYERDMLIQLFNEHSHPITASMCTFIHIHAHQVYL